MITEFLELTGSESVDEMQRRFGQVLGLEGPLPIGAFNRAVEDPVFASHLITARGTPGFLMPLIGDKRNADYEPEKAEDSARHHSNTALASKAAKALFKWGKAGFSVADEETQDRRLSACSSCPHLSDPEVAVQKLVSTLRSMGKHRSGTGDRTCSMCGCFVATKVRIPSEACPDRDPNNPDHSRWGEAYVES